MTTFKGAVLEMIARGFTRAADNAGEWELDCLLDAISEAEAEETWPQVVKEYGVDGSVVREVTPEGYSGNVVLRCW